MSARGAPADEVERAAREAREPPPILGSWGRLYAAVIANLALIVALLWWLTRTFS